MTRSSTYFKIEPFALDTMLAAKTNFFGFFYFSILVQDL
ncbi:hypothetical protein LEP1GSC192_3623 [Leptospira sp. B5-022]|nr:hypothetical protein LEP1GSC192_3623 [Leptospira sp. B5-022]